MLQDNLSISLAIVGRNGPGLQNPFPDNRLQLHGISCYVLVKSILPSLITRTKHCCFLWSQYFFSLLLHKQPPRKADTPQMLVWGQRYSLCSEQLREDTETSCACATRLQLGTQQHALCPKISNKRRHFHKGVQGVYLTYISNDQKRIHNGSATLWQPTAHTVRDLLAICPDMVKV